MGAGAPLASAPAAGPLASRHPRSHPSSHASRHSDRSRRQGGSLVTAPGIRCTSDAALCVAWVSLDPRTGQISPYPEAVAQELENFFGSSGGTGSVSLGRFGPPFEDKTVDLAGGDGEQPVQRAGHGAQRDVRRIPVPADGVSEEILHLVREHYWRIAEIALPGVTQERRVRIIPTKPDSTCSPADREAALAEDDAAGLLGVWEWSLLLRTAESNTGSAEQWGVYSPEQNDAIEAAYRRGDARVTVTIGIRSYDIDFQGVGRARQTDSHLKKRREVRRRALSADERHSLLQPTSSAAHGCGEFEEEECAMCCCEFAETPAMPVVRLPGCGHVFHGACIQELADKGDVCPMCRAVVDWKVALA